MESVERTIEREQRVIALDHGVNLSCKGGFSAVEAVKSAELFYAFLTAKDANKHFCPCTAAMGMPQSKSWYDFQERYLKEKDAK